MASFSAIANEIGVIEYERLDVRPLWPSNVTYLNCLNFVTAFQSKNGRVESPIISYVVLCNNMILF